MKSITQITKLLEICLTDLQTISDEKGNAFEALEEIEGDRHLAQLNQLGNEIASLEEATATLAEAIQELKPLQRDAL